MNIQTLVFLKEPFLYKIASHLTVKIDMLVKRQLKYNQCYFTQQKCCSRILAAAIAGIYFAVEQEIHCNYNVLTVGKARLVPHPRFSWQFSSYPNMTTATARGYTLLLSA